MTALALMLLLVSPGLVAQSIQQPAFRAGVEVIEVDTAVLDADGRPVAGLLAPEFTVTIDGKPRRIVSAEYTSIPLPDGNRPGANRAPVVVEADASDSFVTSNSVARQAGRLIALVVDRESIGFGEGRQAIRAATRFLDRLGPRDQVAFFTVPLAPPSVGFTSNFRLIRNALEQSGGVAHRLRMDLNIGTYEAYSIIDRNDRIAEDAVYARICGHLRGSLELQCEVNVREQAGIIASDLRVRTENSIQALAGILRMLQEIEGPKSLVWISEGLALSTRHDMSEIGRLAAASRTTVNVLVLDTNIADVVEAQVSPSAKEDQQLGVRGLERLAAETSGALYRVNVTADFAFQQMERELSGYYLLGVETVPGDHDGKRHVIKVTVGRKGMRVRARREFRASPDAAATRETVDDRLRRMLQSPFALTELPLRISTFAYREPNTSKVRVLVATEVDRGDNPGGEVTIAFAMIDAEGKVVVSLIQRPIPADSAAGSGPILDYTGVSLVEPGKYTLKLAAIDDRGRRGSVEHAVTAWQMSDVPFAVSDLLIADSPSMPDGLVRPKIETLVGTGRLVGYMELYSDRPDDFDKTSTRLEVATSDAAPALTSVAGSLQSGQDLGTRTVTTVVPVDGLPPGQYVARAMVARDGQPAGRLVRPFRIDRTTAPSVSMLLSLLPPAERFDPRMALKPEVLAHFMDRLDEGRPAIKGATTKARTGRFDGVARQAFDSGDQMATAFLRGIELLAAGDLSRSSTQFSAALAADREFSPAAFYLGVCYAAVGRDAEAMTAWRRSLLGPDKPPLTYTALADAAYRTGDLQQVIPPLRDALASSPDNDDVRRRLAVAQALTLARAEALSTIEPYISKHPRDHEALFLAAHAIYAARVSGQPLLNGSDSERMTAYARAYEAANGPHSALVNAWARFMSSR